MDRFELLLFSTDTPFISACLDAGIDGTVVDWETRGKAARQAGADTQINTDTPEDLRRVKQATGSHVVCRINAFDAQTADEINLALACGADEIWVPMVRSVCEVEFALDRAGEAAGVSILVETTAALEILDSLAKLPLARVYAGLNDLAIQKGSRNIFAPLADGTLEQIRAAFNTPFGFGGLTLPDRGSPIPCRLLIGEMARLGCNFSLLRRSFHRDIAGKQPAREIPAIKEALRKAALRGPRQVEAERSELTEAIRKAGSAAAPDEVT